MLGFVDDLRRLREALVFIVPIFVSTGVNTKIFKAFESSLPLISTSAAVDAAGLGRSRAIIVCDVPACWVDNIRTLVSTPELWNEMSRLSRELGRRLITENAEESDFVVHLQRLMTMTDG
jgi:hypothetical protein